MKRLGIALAFITVFLASTLAAGCYCDDPKLYVKGGYCIDSKLPGDTKYLCCAPNYLCGQFRCAGYADFSCYTGVATDATASDAGTQVVKAWSTTNDVTAACTGNLGKACDINPIPATGETNGWSASSKPDRGVCDYEDSQYKCIKCSGGIETSYSTSGPSIGQTGDQLCDTSCGGVSNQCDEKAAGDIPDPLGDRTKDSGTGCTYTNTNTCESD